MSSDVLMTPQYGTSIEQAVAEARAMRPARHVWAPNLAEYPQLVEHVDHWPRVSLLKGIRLAILESRALPRLQSRMTCRLFVPGSSVVAIGTLAQLETLEAALVASLPAEIVQALD